MIKLGPDNAGICLFYGKFYPGRVVVMLLTTMGAEYVYHKFVQENRICEREGSTRGLYCFFICFSNGYEMAVFSIHGSSSNDYAV